MNEIASSPSVKTSSTHAGRDSVVRPVAYLASTAIVVLVFVGSGVANLTHTQHIAHDMQRLGYPGYFMSILGTWKVLGAIAVALPRLPRLKEWAYAGMIFDLTGGAASRAATGDAAFTIVVPLTIACLVLASWALRPAGSQLVAASGPRQTRAALASSAFSM